MIAGARKIDFEIVGPTTPIRLGKNQAFTTFTLKVYFPLHATLIWTGGVRGPVATYTQPVGSVLYLCTARLPDGEFMTADFEVVVLPYEDTATISVAPPKDWNTEPRQDLIGMIPPGVVSVLDMGCWKGYTLQELLRLGYKAGGADLEDCREVAADADFVYTNLSKGIAHEENSFDCVIAGDVIEHVINTQHALRDLLEVLKPGGTLILSVPNIGFLDAICVIVNQQFPRHDCGHFDQGHLRWFTRDAIEAEVIAAGFVEVEVFLKRFENVAPWSGPDEEVITVQVVNLQISGVTKDFYNQLSAYQIIVRGKKP